MNRTELKATALATLKGKWQWAVIMTLITAILVSAVNGIVLPAGGWPLVVGTINGVTTGLGGLIGGIFWVGYAYTFLDLTAGKQEPNFMVAIVAAFTQERFIPVFLTWLLSTLFIFLWSLLFIIPGIVKALAYSQSFLIIKDLKDRGQTVKVTAVITRSRELMTGHKWEFLMLQLSFLGWALASILTLGIGFLWLIPYVQTTNVLYYRQLAGDRFKEATPAVRPAD